MKAGDRVMSNIAPKHLRQPRHVRRPDRRSPKPLSTIAVFVVLVMALSAGTTALADRGGASRSVGDPLGKHKPKHRTTTTTTAAAAPASTTEPSSTTSTTSRPTTTMAPTSTLSPTTTTAPASASRSLAFNDEFNGAGLDTSKWSTQYPRPGSMCCSNPNNGEAQWYLNRNVVEQNGELHLVAKRESYNGFAYTSGLIQSKQSFNFTYGYAEARMWVPKGSGFWPAFWTWPQNELWPPEIDAMEFYGDNVHRVYMTYHGSQGSNASIATDTDWTTGWHTFGIDWQPSSIRWYIDGNLVKTLTRSDVSTTPMYLIANLAIANGSRAPAPNSSTTFPSPLRIDWVRVWKAV